MMHSFVGKAMLVLGFVLVLVVYGSAKTETWCCFLWVFTTC